MLASIDKNLEQTFFLLKSVVFSSDDIEEAYKHLRRLVMDYLGISVPSFESEVGDMAETKDTENNAPTGTQMGTRTWSRPSIPDSMSQAYTRGKTTQSPSLSGRGILVSVSVISTSTSSLGLFQ